MPTPSAGGPYIRSVRLTNIRGFADEVTVSLGRTGGPPLVSMTLMGENGSGKSSVADAIEFGLRGVVSRRSVGGAKQRRELRNLVATASAPRVEIDFSDGTSIARGQARRGSSVVHAGQEPLAGFAYCPVVVRRRDIDGFWLVPDELRRQFFFDYLREPRGAFLDAERRDQVEAEAVSAEWELSDARQDFEEAANWQPRWPEKIPQWKRFRAVAVAKGRKARIPRKELNDRLDDLEDLLRERNHKRGYANAAGEHDWSVEAEKLEQILRSAGPRVAADFVAITSLPVAALDFKVDGDSGLSLRVRFDDGIARAPQDILSEAQLDLMALLVLIEVHIECASLGQRKVIVLDDVFQSVDRELRARAVDHLAVRLSGWQILVTVHDRLWSEIVRRSLMSAGHDVAQGELRATSFGVSPAFVQSRADIMADTRAAVSSGGSPALIVGAAGRALEAALELSTQALGTRLARSEGDRYTINELWSPFVSELKLCDTSDLDQVMDRVESKRYLRNAIGAHYNEVAETFTLLEANEFANLVQELVDALFCATCGRPRRRASSSPGRWILVNDRSCKHSAG
ncbi:AAA family ATPase [Microbacterium aurum]